MQFRPSVNLRAISRIFCARQAVLLIAIFIDIREAEATDFTIGAPQVIYTKSQRKSAGGSNWPDGSIGVASNGDGTYDFYAANGPKPTFTTGTLTNPGGSSKT